MENKFIRILSIVANYYNIDKYELLNKKRNYPISYYRQIAMSLLYEEEYRFTYIASMFSRHYSTVMYAYYKIQDEIKWNPLLAKQYDEIQRQIDEIYNRVLQEVS